MDAAEWSPWIKKTHECLILWINNNNNPMNYSIPTGCQGRQWLLAPQLLSHPPSFLIRLQVQVQIEGQGPRRGISAGTASCAQKGFTMKEYKSGKWGGWMPVKAEAQSKRKPIPGLLKASLHLASRTLSCKVPLGFSLTHSHLPLFPFLLPSNIHHLPPSTAWLLAKMLLSSRRQTLSSLSVSDGDRNSHSMGL